MNDYLLGGDHSFESDRTAAERLKAQMPEVADTAWANRGFHRRAGKWIAEQGVAQFIDIRPGLPALGNTHDIVGRVNPQARVVYADNDPVVLAHSGELIGDDQAAAMILADIREPDELLAGVRAKRPDRLHRAGRPDDDRRAAFRLRRSQPEGADREVPVGVRLRQLPRDVAPHDRPQAADGAADAGRGRGTRGGGSYYRSKAEIRALFDGLELVSPYDGAEPDVAWVGLWGCEDPVLADSEGSRWLYCAVARKP